MAQETRVQSKVESYQRLKKLYSIRPCLTLNIIRYGSTVKWSNPKKGVAQSPIPLYSNSCKGGLWVAHDYGHQLFYVIYIVIHRQIFRVSQIFSVARNTVRFKMGSKPAPLYAKHCIFMLSHQVTYVSSGIITHHVLAFICLYFALPNTRVLNSLEELCITRVAAVDSFARVLNPREGSIHLSSTDRLFHCITTLQCG